MRLTIVNTYLVFWMPFDEADGERMVESGKSHVRNHQCPELSLQVGELIADSESPIITASVAYNSSLYPVLSLLQHRLARPVHLVST